MTEIDNNFFQFLYRNPNTTINTISKLLPLKVTDMILFKDILNWDLISENTNIGWNYEVIESCKEYLNWEILSLNQNLPWSFDLIKKIEEYWDREDWNWEILSRSDYLPWEYEFIKTFEGSWNW